MNDITMKISLIANDKNVPAYGKTPLRLHAIVTNIDGGVPDININFTIEDSSYALFDGNVNSVIVDTDQNGEAYVNVYNTEVEYVTIKASLVNGDTALPEEITIEFTEAEPLKISRVYNENKDFSKSHPTTAWFGARIFFETTGGSGGVSWHI